MKRSSFVVIAFVTAFALGACGGASQKDAEGFPPAETLAADRIAINEVLQPSWCGVYGDYMVLVSPQTSKLIFRYKLPEWTFADSTFVKGGGPDDLQYGFLEGTNNSDGTFWLSEPVRKALMKFGTKDGKLEKLRTVANDTRFRVYFGQVLSDKVLVSEKQDENNQSTDESKTHLYSAVLGDSLTVADSLLCYTKSAVQITQNGEMTYMSTRTYNKPALKAWGDRLAVWYGDTQNLLVYKVNGDGKMNLEKTFGDTLSHARIESVDVKGYKWEKPTPELITVTDKYLYFQLITYDKPFSQATRENPPVVVTNEIKVYDWDMKPVRKFELDKKEASRVFVDEPHKKIYAYDRRLDFEQVYTYDYKL